MATSAAMRALGIRLFALMLVVLVGACEGKLDEHRFRRKAEKAYMEVNYGWTIVRREEDETIFVRGDQIDRLRVAGMFEDYQKSGKSGSDYFDEWMEKKKAEAEARRRTLDQAAAEVIPIIKSGSWIQVQDLGAIGPKRIQDKIRPWRKEIATDVYAVLGIPEAKLGYRFASIEEVTTHEKGEEAWLEKAIENVTEAVGTSTGAEVRSDAGRLLVLDMKNVDGVAALILSDRFRRGMLARFNQPELGAAVPIRNVLVIFEPSDFVTVKPIRARTHQLYDTQNHPGFRGLLRFDKNGLSVLEPADPKKAKQAKPAE